MFSNLLLFLCILGLNGADRADLEDRIERLQRSLTRTKNELDNCYQQLHKKPDSFISQAWTSLGSCLGGSQDKAMKPLVAELLKILNVNENLAQSSEFNQDLTFTSTATDIQTLRRFVLYDDVNFIHVQEILLGGLRRCDGPGLWGIGSIHIGSNKLHPSMALFCIASLVFLAVLIPLLLGARKRMILLVVACYCIVHTWLGEYWKAVAKKESILAKHGPNMINCRLEKRGYAGSVSAWLSGLFNGQEDPCEEYYRAAMVDPAFEVNLVHALVESVSQLMGVLGGLGKAMGHLVTNFIAPLPLVFKIPALLVGGVFLTFLCLILFGYQFSTFFFSIGPAKEKPAKKLLNKSKNALKAAGKDSETETEQSDTEVPHRKKKKEKPGTAVKLPYPPPPLPYPRDNQLIDLVNSHPDNRPSYKN